MTNLREAALEFEVDARFSCPLAVLQVHGELDFATAEHVGWAIGQAIGHGCRLLALDLAAVSFIDCAAIGGLVAARHQVDSVSGHLWLTRVSPAVSRLLRLTGTAPLFELGGNRGAPATPAWPDGRAG